LLNQGVTNGFDGVPPELGVVPDVGIDGARGGGKPIGLRDRFAYGHPGLASLGARFKHLGQLAFQVKADGEHEVGFGQPLGVADTRLVEVRIDARAHERGGLDMLASDRAHGVVDHADCRKHAQGVAIGAGRRRGLARQAEHEQNEWDKPPHTVYFSHG
jgi:hypothetical protein